jgi:hypothetical protein
MRYQTLYTAFILGFSLAPELGISTCTEKIILPSPRIAAEVYKGMPFAKEEFHKLNVSYLGLNAGYIELRVLEPLSYNEQWLMGFDSLVKTGDWYEKIFKARDQGIGYAFPELFTPYQFRMMQNNVPLIGKKYTEDKLISFDTTTCAVKEEYRDEAGKITKTVQAPLDFDAVDILSALYKIRTMDFVNNKEARIKVYTSEKNWWLIATREDFVRLTVPAGKFDAVRLKLQTYLGKELQQKGNVRIWIAMVHPNRPLLKIEAEIKIGSFIAVLQTFTPGLH